jgi:hypothetical protein
LDFIGDRGKQEEPVKIALHLYLGLLPKILVFGLTIEQSSAIVQPIAQMSTFVS